MPNQPTPSHGPSGTASGDHQHIKELAHHICTITPPAKLANVGPLLKQHPVSHRVYEDYWKHTLGKSAPDDDRDSE